ncbi:GNAT family N-acetyltransferase [Actinoalloteichus hymeniacidonis]|uniref:Acetyltransferase (GNAT) family protein n=1 Tax=Actinoalloteichus hymeniacidonis TaxID=340345 RepID=A0AAC9HPX8_9PSEU|nr:GNAT family N-acetyltransferase [Actinoalloteichus hymeniacidonis]AOS63204.1 acetyltransferase (GNAT) family protein [Actinoalloteichus hymeniacidonis]MBB5908759.1 GNAT superfamily N-acetyltransferase [Actinoalloteichus hymeniacidonis]
MRLRPWTVDDAPALAGVIASGEQDVLWAQGRALLGPQRDGEHWRRTIVAEIDGTVVGMGALLSPRFHPRRLWVYVEVRPDQRRRGIGTAIFTALRELGAADGRPLRAKVRPGGPSAGFAWALGLQRLLIDSEIRGLRADRFPRPEGFGRAVALDDPRLARAFRDFYVAAHPTDPPHPQVGELLSESHLSAAIGAVLVEATSARPAGAALLFQDDGWIFSGGSLQPHSTRAPGVVRELLCTMASALPPRTDLLVEVDDSMADVHTTCVDLGAQAHTRAWVVAER